MIRIPLTPELREQRQIIALAGTRYALRTEWLERVGAWYLHLATAADVPLLTGRRILGTGYLLTGLVDDRRPGGQIIAVSSSDLDTPPGWADLGTGRRTELVFATWAEIESFWGV